MSTSFATQSGGMSRLATALHHGACFYHSKIPATDSCVRTPHATLLTSKHPAGRLYLAAIRSATVGVAPILLVDTVL